MPHRRRPGRPLRIRANGNPGAGKHSDSCFVDLHDFEHEAVGRPEECDSSGPEAGVDIARRDQYLGSQSLDFLELALKIVSTSYTAWVNPGGTSSGIWSSKTTLGEKTNMR